MKFFIGSISRVTQQSRCSKTGHRDLVSAISLVAISSLLAACGGGSSGGDPEPDPIVSVTSTSDLLSTASDNIGSSLDASLDGASRVTTGGAGSGGVTDDPADSGIGGLWSDDAQSLIDTSLALGNEDAD